MEDVTERQLCGLMALDLEDIFLVVVDSIWDGQLRLGSILVRLAKSAGCKDGEFACSVHVISNLEFHLHRGRLDTDRTRLGQLS